MIRAALLSIALLLLTAFASHAADFSGQWKGAVEANGEKIDLVYDLKVDGNKLTGSVEGPAGKMEIEDGKIDGDKITFQVSFGGEHYKHEGKMADGKIKITSLVAGGPPEYTVSHPVNFNGVWKGKAEIAGQQMELIYTLKAEKEKMTGSIESPRGKIEMTDGKISGDTFTFVTKRGDVEVKHEATYADGKINIKVHTSTGDREYKLSRVVDIAGAWQTKIHLPDGTDLDLKYDLKTDGDKLTGTVEGPAGKLDLKEGKIDGDQISYKVTIMDNDVSYQGNVVDGKIELKSHGGPFGDREYTLTRPVEIAGDWEAMFKADDGSDLPLKFNLKVDGDKLTGTVKSAQGDGDIKNGKINGNEISFDVDFQGSTITHKGTMEGKGIKLKVNGFGTSWDLDLKRPAAK